METFWTSKHSVVLTCVLLLLLLQFCRLFFRVSQDPHFPFRTFFTVWSFPPFQLSVSLSILLFSCFILRSVLCLINLFADFFPSWTAICPTLKTCLPLFSNGSTLCYEGQATNMQTYCNPPSSFAWIAHIRTSETYAGPFCFSMFAAISKAQAQLSFCIYRMGQCLIVSYLLAPAGLTGTPMFPSNQCMNVMDWIKVHSLAQLYTLQLKGNLVSCLFLCFYHWLKCSTCKIFSLSPSVK